MNCSLYIPPSGCNQGVRDSKLPKSSIIWNFLSYASLFKESCPKLCHVLKESCSKLDYLTLSWLELCEVYQF